MYLSFLILLSVHTTIADYEPSYQRKDHSLAPPYHTNTWNAYGSTVIEPGYIRLTSDTVSQKGGISSNVPVMFRNWEVVVSFHVHGTGRTLFGDGFAFWYTEKPLVSGSSFYIPTVYPHLGSAFGSWEKFRGLGVFFDTYANQNGEHSHEHPYISAMVNDGQHVYDHDRDGTLTQLDGCSSDFRSVEHAKAKIRYVRNELSVVLSYPGAGKEVNCFVADNVHLPIGYYYGISAATGELSDNHDIISIRTYEIDLPHPPNETTEDWAKIEPSAGGAAPPRKRVEDLPPVSHTSRILWSVIYWMFVLMCIALTGFLCYMFYIRRQRNLKRLY